MIRSAASKVAWVGRTASMVFGLALVLALLFGVATSAMGANGNPFLLGKSNVATALSKLTGNVNGAAMQVVNSNAGSNDTALDLRVQAGESPMRVNSATKVANLNADKLDGMDSGAFFKGTGQMVDGRATISSDSTVPVTNVPGFGNISVIRQFAPSGNDCRTVFRNESGGELFRLGIRDNSGTVSSGVGDVDPSFGNGGEIELAGADIRPRSGFGTWQIVTPDMGKALTLTVSTHWGVPNNADCEVAVHGIYREQ